jgi:protein-tyrosine phosphatase
VHLAQRQVRRHAIRVFRALGVPETLIREDYLASRRWPGAVTHRASLESRLGTFIATDELRAAVDAVLDVREAYLDAALAAAVDEYGSVDRYLAAGAGLTDTRREQLRDRLLR